MVELKLATWPTACTPASVLPAPVTVAPLARRLLDRPPELPLHGPPVRLDLPAVEIAVPSYSRISLKLRHTDRYRREGRIRAQTKQSAIPAPVALRELRGASIR